MNVATQTPATGCRVPRIASQASGVMATVAMPIRTAAPIAADRYGVMIE